MSLARAIETGDLTALPSRRDEDWRWTDLRGLLRVLPPSSRLDHGPIAPGRMDAFGEPLLLINGRGPVRLSVAAGESRTVVLRVVAARGAGAHMSRLSIDVGPDAGLTLLESHEGLVADYVAETAMTITLGQGARLERIVLADDDASAVAVSTTKIALGHGARLAQTVLTTGARRQRLETRVAHAGGGGSARLDGVYVLTGQRHADITTVVAHTGVEGATDQLVKGVVTDQARGVFQGRILVSPGADKTDARMGHHALILSDRAEVDAKPELEIFADDVACAHGNTIGALDEEALFYAMQRGVPEAAAKAMLTEAFLAEVVDRIVDVGARGVAGAWLAERLRRAG